MKNSPPAHSRGRGNPDFAKNSGLSLGQSLGPRVRGDERRRFLHTSGRPGMNKLGAHNQINGKGVV
jgi:hypothetical protein